MQQCAAGRDGATADPNGLTSCGPRLRYRVWHSPSRSSHVPDHHGNACDGRRRIVQVQLERRRRYHDLHGAGNDSATGGRDVTMSATWTLGSTTGVQTLRISVSTTDYIDVDVTATALPANQLSITTQPATTAIAGQPLTGQPVVQLRDARGQEVPQSGVVVTASIASGGGTLGGA